MAGPKKVLYVGKFEVQFVNFRSNLACEKHIVNFTGGLAEEVNEKVVKSAFIPFGEISEVQIPIDYDTEKHRGFAFVEFELPEDAKAAMDNMVGLKSRIFYSI